MPNYNFYDTFTCDYFQKWFDSYKDVEAWMNDGDHDHVNWLCGAPGQVDPVRIGRTKTDDNFKDLLKTIKGGSPKSTIDV